MKSLNSKFVFGIALAIAVPTSYGASCYYTKQKSCKKATEAASAWNNYGSSCTVYVKLIPKTVPYITAFRSAEDGCFISYTETPSAGKMGWRLVFNTVEDCKYNCNYTNPCGEIIWKADGCTDWEVPTSMAVEQWNTAVIPPIPIPGSTCLMPPTPPQDN